MKGSWSLLTWVGSEGYLDDLLFGDFLDGDLLGSFVGEDHLPEGTFAQLLDNGVAEDLIIIHAINYITPDNKHSPNILQTTTATQKCING